MSLVSAPFGLKPVWHPSGLMRPDVLVLTKALAEATPSMGKHTPVQLDATGRLALAANGADYCGVFLGVEFTLADGTPKTTNRWINGTVVLDQGANSARFYFTRDPEIIYEIQASGPVADNDIGEQSPFLNPGTFNATTGLSSAALDAGTIAVGQNMMKIMNLSRKEDNAWGDAFTIVQVKIARHQEVALKAGF